MGPAINVNLDNYDAEQARLMEEMLIVVDGDDKRIGADSKKNCHLMQNINNGLLHRAFSVFLFSSEGKLLLQQRSSNKITFPDQWTNTCCSHPLNTSAELEEEDQIGVRRAAQRKLGHELGIHPEQVPLDKLTFLTRIHYVAPSDGQWGEHEVDYIFVIKADVNLNVNSNEVRDVCYVSREELREKLANPGDWKYTPWFKLITERFLFDWWDNLDNLEAKKDLKTIHTIDN